MRPPLLKPKVKTVFCSFAFAAFAAESDSSKPIVEVCRDVFRPKHVRPASYFLGRRVQGTFLGFSVNDESSQVVHRVGIIEHVEKRSVVSELAADFVTLLAHLVNNVVRRTGVPDKFRQALGRASYALGSVAGRKVSRIEVLAYRSTIRLAHPRPAAAALGLRPPPCPPCPPLRRLSLRAACHVRRWNPWQFDVRFRN